MRQIYAYAARGGSLAYNYIERAVLHGGVKNLLHRALKPVYLVDKQNVAVRETRQKRGKIAGLFYGGTARYAQIRAHLCGDYSRKRGLSETGRTVQQHMVERVSALLCRLYVYFQVFLDLGLSDIILKAAGSERRLRLAVLGSFDSREHTALLLISIEKSGSAREIFLYHSALPPIDPYFCRSISHYRMFITACSGSLRRKALQCEAAFFRSRSFAALITVDRHTARSAASRHINFFSAALIMSSSDSACISIPRSAAAISALP